jgi:hypothetical protein
MDFRTHLKITQQLSVGFQTHAKIAELYRVSLKEIVSLNDSCSWKLHAQPKKSTTRASLELQVPQKAVWNILRKRLRMFPYRMQLL